MKTEYVFVSKAEWKYENQANTEVGRVLTEEGKTNENA